MSCQKILFIYELKCEFIYEFTYESKIYEFIYEFAYELISVNTQRMNSHLKRINMIWRLPVGCSKYGDQGVPDPNDEANFGFVAAAAASH